MRRCASWDVVPVHCWCRSRGRYIYIDVPLLEAWRPRQQWVLAPPPGCRPSLAARPSSLQKQSLVGKPWGGDKVEDYLRQRAAEMAATQQRGGEKGIVQAAGSQPAAAS